MTFSGYTCLTPAGVPDRSEAKASRQKKALSKPDKPEVGAGPDVPILKIWQIEIAGKLIPLFSLLYNL